MKKKVTYLIVPAVILIALVFIRAYRSPERGPHGGELKGGKGYFVEMKHSIYMIQTYLLDGKKKTMSSADLQCEVVLYYADSSTYKMGMSPKGDHGFYGFVPDNYYSSCLVRYIWEGKQITETFENNAMIVGDIPPDDSGVAAPTLQ